MSSLRLVFAIEKYFEYGGLQRDLLRVARDCARRGHAVHVVTGGWQGPQPEGVAVHVVDLRAQTNHARMSRLGKELRRFVERTYSDCVVGFQKLPSLDVYFAGDACLAASLTERPLGRLLRLLPRYRKYLELEAAVFGSASDAEVLVLVPGEKERIQRCWGTPADRVHVLPPGVDREAMAAQPLSAGERDELRRSLGVDGNDGFLLLSVGSGFRTKGVDRSIRALASLPEPTRRRSALAVVGEGRSEPLRKLARRLGVGGRVVFAGGRGDVARFYHSADLLLHPARIEIGGMALLEAMVCGLPVLASARCGYAFHVECAHAGFLCPEPFVQGRFDAIVAGALAEAAQRRRWRENALAYSLAQDLYGKVDRVVELVLARAERNRAQR